MMNRQRRDSSPGSEYPPYNKEVTKQHARSPVESDVHISCDFVKCRAGYQLNEYHEDLDQVLIDRHIDRQDGFIIAPIGPGKAYNNSNHFETLLPHTVLPYNIWDSRVAIDLGYQSWTTKHGDFSFKASKHFDCVFRHALYLPTPVIIIDCPNYDLAYVSLVSVITNQLIRNPCKTKPLILFKVSPSDSLNTEIQSCSEKIDSCPSSIAPILVSTPDFSLSDLRHRLSQSTLSENGQTSISGAKADSDSNQEEPAEPMRGSWKHWIAFREHLPPDPRFGLCLVIDDDLTEDEEILLRWVAEPIHMIIIDVNQFTRSSNPSIRLQLNTRCKNFLRKIAEANSLKTSFVVSGKSEQDVTEYLEYLDHCAYQIKSESDHSLKYDDVIQRPLQPLSANSNSNTYRAFEQDTVKYLQYRDAMISAIKHLISKMENSDRKIVVMTLGAGRGALVDYLINAIEKVQSDFKFKIYALDKNPSSVLALKYKLEHSWLDSTGCWDVEVVETDMRCWESGVKADIIVTELLGSLSDNELSPECIDGVWRLTTPETISIPQEYSSFIAPICSPKLHQDLYNYKKKNPTAFDQVYVVKLTNVYHIADPLQLFKFEHYDLSLNPAKRNNSRYASLQFWSKVDTVCHGFAGYFIAKLFEKVTISTLVDHKTPNIGSWFPAFIPLEQPIHMSKGTKLDVQFWREDCPHFVWYRWAVMSPVQTRLHSQYGMNTAMSKLCIS